MEREKALKALTKPTVIKKSAKQDRERQVLISLIELYLQTGKPIGSNTLKESYFEELSSATIRNYFAELEKEGYLSQQHISGGRVPTAKAIRLYVNEYQKEDSIPEAYQRELNHLRLKETQELTAYLEEAAERLSQYTNCAVFLSAPRFENDYIQNIKIVSIDYSRCLCIILTNFGAVYTEILHHEKRLNSFSLKRIETYFQWRLIHSTVELDNFNKSQNLSEEEAQIAQQFYNEIMMRFIVSYSNFNDEDIYRTGFSKLLSHPELQETSILTNCLSLFENVNSIRLLLRECSKKDTLRFWIGDDLQTFIKEPYEISVLTIPYYINKQSVGAIGLLGPLRIPYRLLFGLLHKLSESISEALTRSIYKFKITYRQPQTNTISPIDEESKVAYYYPMLIEHNHK